MGPTTIATAQADARLTRLEKLFPGSTVERHRDWFWWVGNAQQRPSAAMQEFVQVEFDRLHSELQIRAKRPPIFIFADSFYHFSQILKKLKAGSKPEYVLAIAFPGSGIMVVNGGQRFAGAPGSFLQTIIHEMVHVILGGADLQVPRWYHEGVAQFFSGERVEKKQMQDLAAWAHAGNLIRMGELDSYLAEFSHHRSSIFYRHSLSFVDFTERHFGPNYTRRVLAEFKNSKDIYQALSNTSGLSMTEMEDLWQAELAGQFSFFKYTISFLQPFSPLALICVAGYLFQRHRRRQSLARMAKQEQLEDEQSRLLGSDSDSELFEDR